MRILLLSSSSGSRGGGEFYLLGLAKGLMAMGHTVCLLMSDHESMDEFAALCVSAEIEVKRFDYVNTYRRRLRALAANWDAKGARAVARVVRQEKPDIVHINQQCVEDGLDLYRAGALSGLPCVATIHVTRSMQQLGASLGWLRDRVARRTITRSRMPLIGISQVSALDLVTYISASNDGQSRDCLATDPNQVFAVANGVEDVSCDGRTRYREEWGLSQDAFVLGCIARLEEQKNPAFIVPLMKALPESAHLVWVGDGRLRSSVEQSCQSAGLQGRITFDGWRSDAADRMAGFDTFILPSLYEGLPLAILEAMSASLPTVVSDVDGTRDAVLDGDTGFLCPVNDVQIWASRIQTLMDNRAQRLEMGQRARQRYEAEFSLNAMARRTFHVYENVLRAFRQPAGQSRSGDAK